MASLHAFTNNSTPLAIMQVPADRGHHNDISVKHANEQEIFTLVLELVGFVIHAKY